MTASSAHGPRKIRTGRSSSRRSIPSHRAQSAKHPQHSNHINHPQRNKRGGRASNPVHKRKSRYSKTENRTRRPHLGLLLGLVLIGSLLSLGALGFWYLRVYPYHEGSGTPRERTLTIAPNTSWKQVSTQLHAIDAVRLPKLFELYARLQAWRASAPRSPEPGKVRIRGSMSPYQLWLTVARRPLAQVARVTLPEGANRWEIAQRLEDAEVCAAKPFLDLLRAHEEGGPAEGTLFPETYEFKRPTLPHVVLRRLHDTARTRHRKLRDQYPRALRQLERELQWGWREVLILASMVEKEAQRAEERPRIAGVFFNRLLSPRFKPHLLQSDPTVIYGCLRLGDAVASCRGFDGKRLRRRQLVGRDNPYNTYVHPGLPPGPIAAPGEAAIRAVLAPEEHNYLYFVAAGDGRHRFSATLQEHQDAVKAMLQRNRAKRSAETSRKAGSALPTTDDSATKREQAPQTKSP